MSQVQEYMDGRQATKWYSQTPQRERQRHVFLGTMCECKCELIYLCKIESLSCKGRQESSIRVDVVLGL